ALPIFVDLVPVPRSCSHPARSEASVGDPAPGHRSALPLVVGCAGRTHPPHRCHAAAHGHPRRRLDPVLIELFHRAQFPPRRTIGIAYRTDRDLFLPSPLPELCRLHEPTDLLAAHIHSSGL